MRTHKSSVLMLMGMVIFFLYSISSADVPHMINYQGKLTTATGGCLNDTISMTFSIYPDTLVSPADWTETQTQVVIKDGIFNVLLGSVDSIPVSVFNGSIKYLGVQVESDPEMRPLKPMVSAPYAYRAGAGGGWVDEGTVVRLETDTDYVGMGTITPNAKLDVVGDVLVSGKATIGPGHTNTGTNAFVAGSNNRARGAYSVVSGGGGGSEEDSNLAHGDYSVVGGGRGNTATTWCTVVGGGYGNITSGIFATVGGGSYNKARGDFSVVSGGGGLTANDSNSTIGDYSTIGGGGGNTTESSYATIGGGFLNTASGFNATVGGGRCIRVEGEYSAILGGYADTITATADYSYLFGIKSKLTEDSTFMVDMPHIRFGDESNGYEFPTSDGEGGYVMATDGSGQLNWVDVSGSGGGWIDDGTVVRLETSTDSVGIGTTTPSAKLEVNASSIGASTEAILAKERYGVQGIVWSTGSLDYRGVDGYVSGGSGSNLNIGVAGSAFGSGTNYGVYGTVTQAPGNYAGYFLGNVHVNGLLTKSGGAFKIDHPLDPANKYLYHSFVESPDMKNVYDGVVVLDAAGEAWIELPQWFEALNRDFRYQLTCIGDFAPVYVAEKISDDRFKIAGGDPGMEVCWQVTGIRHDKFAEENRIQVEVEKSAEERGKYIHPETYGLGEEHGIHYEQHKRMDME